MTAHSLTAPVISSSANRLPGPPMFTGAMMPVCGVDVLIVVVRPWILADTHEANLYVVAFNYRFKRTIVLMAQDPTTNVPTYYGPAGIVNTICSLPFEIMPWQRIAYKVPKPPPWRLPIPPEPPRHDTSEVGSNKATRSYNDSLDELAQTRIFEPRDRHRDRMAHTTKR